MFCTTENKVILCQQYTVWFNPDLKPGIADQFSESCQIFDLRIFSQPSCSLSTHTIWFHTHTKWFEVGSNWLNWELLHIMKIIFNKIKDLRTQKTDQVKLFFFKDLQTPSYFPNIRWNTIPEFRSNIIKTYSIELWINSSPSSTVISKTLQPVQFNRQPL